MIELVIVLAIISILAAIAVPSYQGFITRAKVAEGLVLVGGAKTAVMVYYQNHEEFPYDNQIADLPKPVEIKGNYVQSVTVDGQDEKIVVTYAGKALGGRKLELEAQFSDGAMAWSCSSPAKKELHIAAKYLPPNCR